MSLPRERLEEEEDGTEDRSLRDSGREGKRRVGTTGGTAGEIGSEDRAATTRDACVREYVKEQGVINLTKRS